MKRLLIYSPNPLDGVSFYRQWGPMSALRDKVTSVSFSNNTPEYSHWTWYLNYDCALMSRPHKYEDFFFAEQCKKFRLPLWVDYDDALLHIPADNPVADTFNSEKSRKWIVAILQMADVVTVSSQLQKRWFESELKLKNVVFVPNGIDERMLSYAQPFKYNRRVFWRGSDSHLIDLLEYREQIISVMDRFNDWEYLFFGVYPSFITNFTRASNVSFHKSINLIEFFREMCTYNPMITFVPLVDHFFNRVKSNLAWLDATCAGSVALVPKFEGYTEPELPGVRYYEPKYFAKEFETLLQLPEAQLAAMHQLSWEYLKDNLLLSKINEIRLGILNNL